MKETRNRVSKNRRNVGKIRLYEKISIKRRNIIERPAASPLSRKRNECDRQGSVHHGHPLCNVFPGRFLKKVLEFVHNAQNKVFDTG